MPRVLHPDAFNATLLDSPELTLTEEQRTNAHRVLEIASSDSRFVEKAWDALTRILKGTNSVPPVVSSLSPSSAVLGSESFTLSVLGTGFTPTSIINFNGGDETTTYVSPTEVTTGVDMSTASVAGNYPVYVSNGEVASDPVEFEFTSPVVLSVKKTFSPPPVKEESHKGQEKK